MNSSHQNKKKIFPQVIDIKSRTHPKNPGSHLFYKIREHYLKISLCKNGRMADIITSHTPVLVPMISKSEPTWKIPSHGFLGRCRLFRNVFNQNVGLADFGMWFLDRV